jgi:PAS domain-containing protein
MKLKFPQLLAKLPAAAYLCDAEGLITYFNERAVELWGREPKLNDPVDRFCGSFRLFTPSGEPTSPAMRHRPPTTAYKRLRRPRRFTRTWSCSTLACRS